MQGKEVAPRPRSKGFTRHMKELEELAQNRMRSWISGLTKFIKILLVFRLGFDKIMKTNLTKE